MEAPGELALVQRFVNSADLDRGTDELAEPAGLEAWLRAEGLDGGHLGEPDRRRVVVVREALRSLLLSHHGSPVDGEAVAVLDGAASLRVGFGADGAARLEPAGSGADRVIGRLLAIVARAQADGTWERLKACPAEQCGWAFYDRSRNHSRTWCEMRVCGNRAKARSYRARQR